MRLHNCFVICCSDFCKLYPRGMLSLGMWYKPGVQDAARGPQRSTLGSFTTTTKVCETYPPPISLAPVYLILFVPSYLFPPLSIYCTKKGRTEWLDSTGQAHSWNICATVTIQQTARNSIFQGDHREGAVVPPIGEARPRQTPDLALRSSTAGLHALFPGSDSGIAKGLQKQR